MQLWRLTRNEYTRRVYDALKDAGVTATRMAEYVRPLDGESLPEPSTAASLSVHPPGTGPAVGDRTPDETAVTATLGRRRVGRVLVSVDCTHHVEPLERMHHVDGGFVRRLHVDPEARNRGIATSLVARACRVAADEGASEAVALVAADNRPSQWTFEANQFEVRHRHTYARLGSFVRRRTVDVD